MDEFDSGGQSGDKGLDGEDEGTTPIPERVYIHICIYIYMYMFFIFKCLLIW